MRRYKNPLCFTNRNLDKLACQNWWLFTGFYCCLSLSFSAAWIAVLLEVNYFWF
jgi:hypothetical protein